MHRNVTAATIARAPEEVFDFVTTPGTWPRCSPITLSMDVAEPWRPFRAGDAFTERVRVMTWLGHFNWTVEIVEHPNRCVVTRVTAGDTGVSRLGGRHSARIEYTFSGDDGRTHLTIDRTPVPITTSVVVVLLPKGRALWPSHRPLRRSDVVTVTEKAKERKHHGLISGSS